MINDSNNTISVNLVRRNSRGILYDYRHMFSNHSIESRVNISRIILKSEVTKIIEECIVSINVKVNITLLVDTIFNEINLMDFICSKNTKRNPLFTFVIFKMINRLLVEISNVTGVYYNEYLNKVNKDIELLCDSIIEFINA